MRRKVTLNLDEAFVEWLDAHRGDIPRSRYIERLNGEDKPWLVTPQRIAAEAVTPTGIAADAAKVIRTARPTGKPPLQRPIVQKKP